ncbi:MAG TPA: DUF3828 domain-containing protein [Sphingomicrobium sp.]|nr:DUF3828 domain-containing protein [Sphingomicrobium sp.]
MILLLLTAIAQPQAETPREFIERLYADYAKPDYSPFKNPELVFAPRLQAAIEEDSRLFQNEVGYLDGDPICQCQDAEGLNATITSVSAEGPDKATVSVSIGLLGYERRPATFSLVRTKDGWRISDVSSADEPSFLGGIEDSNRIAREGNR